MDFLVNLIMNKKNLIKCKLEDSQGVHLFAKAADNFQATLAGMPYCFKQYISVLFDGTKLKLAFTFCAFFRLLTKAEITILTWALYSSPLLT